MTLSFWTEPTHPSTGCASGLGAERFYRRQWSTALSRLKELIESGPRGSAGSWSRAATGFR